MHGPDLRLGGRLGAPRAGESAGECGACLLRPPTANEATVYDVPAALVVLGGFFVALVTGALQHNEGGAKHCGGEPGALGHSL